MTEENFISILKEYHDNPYKYAGKKIKTSGYVFKAADFQKNQFVIARDMWISKDDFHIVGFLCELDDAIQYQENEWVSAEGKIYIGNYYGPMPIIKIDKIKTIDKQKR